jgi:hypothetical protein
MGGAVNPGFSRGSALCHRARGLYGGTVLGLGDLRDGTAGKKAREDGCDCGIL